MPTCTCPCGLVFVCPKRDRKDRVVVPKGTVVVPKGTVVVVDPSKIRDPFAYDAITFLRGSVEFEPADGLSLAIEKSCVYDASGELVLRASLLKAQGFGRLLVEATIQGIRLWVPQREGRIGKRSFRFW